jgi:ribosomal protein L20A (L18A)
MLKKYTVIGIHHDNDQKVADEVEAASGTEALEAVLQCDAGDDKTRGGCSDYQAIVAIEQIPDVEFNLTFND